jgi:hypothetical protein
MVLGSAGEASRRGADPSPLGSCGVESASIESLTPPKWLHCERNHAVCQTCFNNPHKNIELLRTRDGITKPRDVRP